MGRVLIVDDDRAVLASLASMVEEGGHEAIPTTSWSEALRVSRQTPPDLVLLDVMMPTIDGFKLARMMKSEAPVFVPIILLTALDDIESKRRAMAAGADDFLTKPVTPLELEIRMSSMLRIKELTDQIQAANKMLAEMAVTDPLTGLVNRRSLDEHLEREWARSQRYGNPFSVLMLDVDFFKKVNDNHGHAVGDQVLRLVSETVKQVVRQTDVVGRFGGEEFMVLAPETSSSNAKVLADRIRVRIAGASLDHRDLPGVTVSAGVSSTDRGEIATVGRLVELADEALYEAKRAGRDRVVMAGESAAEAIAPKKETARS
jgi:diguanylate cyclase (GGDEF)-like protein